jgi:GntR family transcriptional regulator
LLNSKEGVRIDDFQPPKYYTVKRAIISHIDDEVYKIGEMIPSERELMQAFEVSRITIRKAVDELEREGYLYRVQGKARSSRATRTART